jgi:hypothetical protein
LLHSARIHERKTGNTGNEEGEGELQGNENNNSNKEVNDTDDDDADEEQCKNDDWDFEVDDDQQHERNHDLESGLSMLQVIQPVFASSLIVASSSHRC